MVDDHDVAGCPPVATSFDVLHFGSIEEERNMRDVSVVTDGRCVHLIAMLARREPVHMELQMKLLESRSGHETRGAVSVFRSQPRDFIEFSLVWKITVWDRFLGSPADNFICAPEEHTHRWQLDIAHQGFFSSLITTRYDWHQLQISSAWRTW